MRNYLEQEMLAESLRGRVRYNSTSFPGMDGCRLCEIYLDGALAIRFAWETDNSDFIRRGKKADPEPHSGTGAGRTYRRRILRRIGALPESAHCGQPGIGKSLRADVCNSGSPGGKTAACGDFQDGGAAAPVAETILSASAGG